MYPPFPPPGTTGRSPLRAWWTRAALFAGLLFFSLRLTGCGGSGESARPPSAEGVVVVEGARFHVPAGWLDFSRDSLRPGILWLVRKDYRASLSVEEVHASGNTADPASAARALLRLEMANDGLRIVTPPSGESGTGGRAVSFQIARREGEEVRVTVVQRGDRLFTVTAVQDKDSPTRLTDFLGAQRAIVDDLLR